jgi:hypothetical protein
VESVINTTNFFTLLAVIPPPTVLRVARELEIALLLHVLKKFQQKSFLKQSSYVVILYTIQVRSNMIPHLNTNILTLYFNTNKNENIFDECAEIAEYR